MLESLFKKYAKEIEEKKLEILVADNDSTDDTLQKIEKIKNIQIIKNGGNVGFAKGNNTAVQHAKGDVLLFINPDTKFIEGDIFSLLDEFQDEKVGVVGGKIISWNNKNEYSCGKFYNAFHTFLLSVGLEEQLGVRFSPDKKQEVDFVSGAFFAIRKDLFEKLHGFDENYFMYIEDCDLCFRVNKSGYKILFCPSATIQHMGQGSSNRTFAIVNIYKGLLYFNKKRINYFSYAFVWTLLKSKALALVVIGKILNNKYLVESYSQALKV